MKAGDKVSWLWALLARCLVSCLVGCLASWKASSLVGNPLPPAKIKQNKTQTHNPTWKLRLMGGLPHGFFSRVVAISSTVALSVCSVSPTKRLSFQTSAWRLGSYLALPAVWMKGRGVRGEGR